MIMSIEVFFKYSILADIYKNIKFNNFKRKWRFKNSHNNTIPNSVFDMTSVTVGNFTYGRLNVVCFNKKNSLIIGNFVSLADDVTFVLDADHYMNHISTYPMRVQITKECKAESIGKGNITVGDDVWIGYGATIMSGVHISQGAVVAAGAVVTKDIPPYAIVGGIPAKVIKYRFSPEMIEELMKIDYSRLTKEQIEQHIDELYLELKDKRQLDWMTKR